ncbi:MAG: hypothetical protein H6740_12335 [Alphaproteobacteria bacterium]|nr:hypothetical protein [Alphaproteobacteria bacterium]
MSALRSLAFALMLTLAALWASPAAAQSWVAPAEDASDPFAALAERPPLPEDFVSVGGLFAEVWGEPQDIRTIDRLADHAAKAVPRIAEQLGVGTGPRMRVVLAADEQGFFAMQPGRAPLWADGTAWPHQALVFLKSPRARPGTAPPLEVVLDHEITHVLLGQAFGHEPVPTWLQEGLAQWIAGEYGPDTVRRLSRASLSGGLLTLDDLKYGFPADPVRANLAYAQSADLIAFIASEHGESAIHDLVEEMARGTPVNAAFRKATGAFAHELDAEWRSRLESKGFGLSLLAEETLWFGLGAPVLVLGWLGVRRRNRRRKEQWAEEEAQRERLVRAMRPKPQGPAPRPVPLDGYRARGDEHPWVH